MNRLIYRSMMATFCTSLLCLGSQAAFAEDQENISVPSNFVKAEEEIDNLETDIANELTATIGQYPYDDSYYLQRIHPNGIYHLVGWMGADGSVAVLQDGSEWSIEWKSRQTVLTWGVAEDVFIKPSISWFSGCKYVLYNRQRNQAVQANLKTAPIVAGAYTFQIINIEPYQRLITLSDYTVWQLSPGSSMTYWQIGQRVMVGVNNKWRVAASPQTLINVDIYGQPYNTAIYYGCFTN